MLELHRILVAVGIIYFKFRLKLDTLVRQENVTLKAVQLSNQIYCRLTCSFNFLTIYLVQNTQAFFW